MEKIKEVIFSDLDGTLIDKNYSFLKSKKAIELLKNKKIPLILISSKTRAEIEVYRKKMKNKEPFISENGGAIFIPKDYFDFKFKSKKRDNYSIIELGTPYKKLVKIMKNINKKFKVTSFYKMSAEEISNQIGLSLKEAKLAKKREYDVVFKIENKKDKNKIVKEIKRRGFNYTEGGNYFHLLGDNDKGKAAKILIRMFKKQNKKIKTFSFGDSKNDFPLFKSTDKSFLVKGPEELNKIVLKKFK
jgi:mannosyl-3-phosphoglycerate phosphatase